MEITYLEIFHKQGLVGLFFWGLLRAAVISKVIVGLLGTGRGKRRCRSSLAVS